MTTALVTGILLGLASGLAPGPLLALVMTQSLRHGPREGCKIALSPLVTDAPIIVLALLTAAELARLRPLLGIVSIAGGAFVLYLAWDNLSPARMDAEAAAASPGSWLKGILTNLLSPHPWLFWLTVGAATLARAMTESWLAAVAFLLGFYLLLSAQKCWWRCWPDDPAICWPGGPYRIVMRVLALLLGVFALLLFREGLRLLGVI